MKYLLSSINHLKKCESIKQIILYLAGIRKRTQSMLST